MSSGGHLLNVTVAEERKNIKKVVIFGYDCWVGTFDELKVGLVEVDLAVMVVSTTGDGDMPDNCLKYFREFKKAGHSSDSLNRLGYVLLCLGDTNYSNFCSGGKTVEELITSKGAHALLETVYADDATGLEDIVDSWNEQLWNILPKSDSVVCADDIATKLASTTLSNGGVDNSAGGRAFSILDKPFPFNCEEYRPSDKTALTPTADLKLPTLPKPVMGIKFFHLPTQPQGEQPYFGMASALMYYPIKSVTRLSGAHSEKITLFVEVSGTFDYQPGDSFSLVVPNDDIIVTSLIQRLHVSHIADIPIQKSSLAAARANSLTHIPEVTTIRYIFTYCVDFTSVPLKKAFFRMLAEYTTDKTEYERLLFLSSRQGASSYDELRLEMLTLVDLLNLFSSCNPPVERIIDNLPVLLPRPYSFASTPLESAGSFSFVFNVDDIPATERRMGRTGIATGYISRNSYDFAAGCIRVAASCFSAPNIPMFLRTQNSFRLPEDDALPVIMIGPGTGVAPFRGFLKHRQLLKQADQQFKHGDMFLLFGCRTVKHDYLFQEELQSFKENGTLTELFACFSRDDDDTGLKYVQDILRKNWSLFADLILNKSAVVYICGDAANMAKDVNEALVDIISQYKEIPNVEARGVIIRLRQDKQIREDVWT